MVSVLSLLQMVSPMGTLPSPQGTFKIATEVLKWGNVQVKVWYPTLDEIYQEVFSPPETTASVDDNSKKMTTTSTEDDNKDKKKTENNNKWYVKAEYTHKDYLGHMARVYQMPQYMIDYYFAVGTNAITRSSENLSDHHMIPLAPLNNKWRHKLPTIVFSHGLYGIGEHYTVICENLASFGYIVIAPYHSDSSCPVVIPKVVTVTKTTTTTTATEEDETPEKATEEVAKEDDSSLNKIESTGTTVATTSTETEVIVTSEPVLTEREVEELKPLIFDERREMFMNEQKNLEQDGSDETTIELMYREYQLKIRLDDIRTILSVLKSMGENGDGIVYDEKGVAMHIEGYDTFAGRIDLERIGGLGHSFGGGTCCAASTTIVEPIQFKCGMSLDGWLDPMINELPRTPDNPSFLDQIKHLRMSRSEPLPPFAFINSDLWQWDNNLKNMDKLLLTLLDKKELNPQTAQPLVYKKKMEGTHHHNFNDLQVLMPKFGRFMNYIGSADPHKHTSELNEIIIKFFDYHMNVVREEIPIQDSEKTVSTSTDTSNNNDPLKDFIFHEERAATEELPNRPAPILAPSQSSNNKRRMSLSEHEEEDKTYTPWTKRFKFDTLKAALF